MSMRFSEEEGAAMVARLARNTGKNPVASSIGGAPSIAKAEAPKKKGRGKSGPSELELMFAEQLGRTHLPMPRREYRFMDDRDFRFDYAWPEQRIAVEVQGMVHRIRERFLRDVEKLAMAQILGWTVLLVAGQDVRSTRAMQWLVTIWEQKK